MNIIGIGDLLIPAGYIRDAFLPLEENGFTVSTVDWETDGYEELQRINLLVEQGGSEIYEPPVEVVEGIKDADIIITQFCPITRNMIDSCPSLKAIGVLRAGVENVNLDYASEKGILVFNTQGRNANAVADFTVGMMISECRNIAKAHRQLKEGNWIRDYSNKDYVPDLCGKTAGIIGFGSIGRKVAKRLLAFDMNVLAYDPFVTGDQGEVTMVSLEDLMENSDFVTIHSRLSKETERMINQEMIGKMKPTAYLINTARSGLVDEDALFEALKNHTIAGAALDVFDVEPPGKDYKLVIPENVTITPHLAGGTRDAFTGSPVLLAAEMRKVFLEKTRSGCLMNLKDCAENELVKEAGL